MQLHTEIFPDNQRMVFDILAEQDWLHHFYMAGGNVRRYGDVKSMHLRKFLFHHEGHEDHEG